MIAGMSRLYEQGSFEAARAQCPTAEFRSLVDSIHRAVPDLDRIGEALSRVRLVPRNTAAIWIKRQNDLGYKQQPNHWPNWQAQGRGIFR